MKTKYKTHENEIAFFIRYATGKLESFETKADRDKVIKEIEDDDAAWAAA